VLDEEPGDDEESVQR